MYVLFSSAITFQSVYTAGTCTGFSATGKPLPCIYINVPYSVLFILR